MKPCRCYELEFICLQLRTLTRGQLVLRLLQLTWIDMVIFLLRFVFVCQQFVSYSTGDLNTVWLLFLFLSFKRFSANFSAVLILHNFPYVRLLSSLSLSKCIIKDMERGKVRKERRQSSSYWLVGRQGGMYVEKWDLLWRTPRKPPCIAINMRVQWS